jgi:hypothetical protein
MRTRVLLAALVLAALPARASDACLPADAAGAPMPLATATHGLCPRGLMERIQASCVEADRLGAVARADAVQAAGERDACRARLASVVALPSPEGIRWWHLAGVGAAGVVVGIAVGIVVGARLR